MDTSRKTRDVFLYCMALIYMFAFGSWFFQIPGLYGDDGLLPIKNVLTNEKNKSFEGLFADKPTILWIFLIYGLSHQTSLELLCVIGTVLSFLCLVFKNARCMPAYMALWFFYFSLFGVGQTFAWFQWDTLLLEAGFLTVLVAPPTPKGKLSSLQRIPFFLTKWLLFRLMFASGVVKLTSMCPTWWGLTALHYHFETQCIPTPAAWWAHQLPKWFLKLNVVGTYLIEIALPFLFFAPVRKLRVIGVYGQVLLMATITVTGNYNFFNFLTLALCLSAVDDRHLAAFGLSQDARRDRAVGTTNFRKLRWYLAAFTTLAVCGIYTYYTITLFGLEAFKNRDLVRSKIAFTKLQFTQWVDEAVGVSIWIAALCFFWESLYTLYLCLRNKNFVHKIWNTVKFTAIFSVCMYMFCISMVPFKTIASDPSCWSIVQRWHGATDKYQLVHSYGLFRRMTGVGGRPEVVVEGSHTKSGPWKEIHFLYKPGNTTGSLPWIVPHQPRLDWQMWFAALGQYHQNPWFLSLVDKILGNKKDVLKLLDEAAYPFKGAPPKYIRADLYHYRFTMIRKNGAIPKGVWKRKFDRSYLPDIDKSHADFKQFLKYHNLVTKKTKKSEAGRLESMVSSVRHYAEILPAHIFLWSLWLTAIAITLSRKIIAQALKM